VNNAARLPGGKHTAKGRKNIARPKKARQPIAVKKKTDGCGKLKKTWMTHLQHPQISMILLVKNRCSIPLVAVSAEERVKLWLIFPEEVTADGMQNLFYNQVVLKEGDNDKKTTIDL